MTNILYQRIDDLVQNNEELTIKLQLSDSEIATLKLHVERLENGVLALNIKLHDSENEIARLGMVLKHRAVALDHINRRGK